MRTLFLIAFAFAAYAQTPPTHGVLLTWGDDANPLDTTYSVYRANGLCSGALSWAKIATAITGKTFDDTTVQPGPYCYAVTATVLGVESAQSQPAQSNVPSFTVKDLKEKSR